MQKYLNLHMWLTGVDWSLCSWWLKELSKASCTGAGVVDVCPPWTFPTESNASNIVVWCFESLDYWRGEQITSHFKAVIKSKLAQENYPQSKLFEIKLQIHECCCVIAWVYLSYTTLSCLDWLVCCASSCSWVFGLCSSVHNANQLNTHPISKPLRFCTDLVLLMAKQNDLAAELSIKYKPQCSR